MVAAPVTILCTGDLVLDVAPADHWLAGIAPLLHAADLAIGHLEVPHTRSTFELEGDLPAPGAAPEHLPALARAGLDAVSLAGNHIADCGPAGIFDTIGALDALGIRHAGAGADLAAARAPASLACRGRRIALLSYNCVGPEAGWATPDRPGCAYLPIATTDGSPVTPMAPLGELTDLGRSILREDIAAARAAADLVLVAMHKGIVHTPALLAGYERPLARLAIDFGADAVIGHHAHIIKGIELHRGKPIFHGLGNGCVVTRALSADQDHPGRAAWARRRRELFGFEPDPAYPLAPFHPQAVHAMFARLVWHGDGRIEAGIVPIHVEPPGRPVPAEPSRAQAIVEYLARITTAAGLPSLTLRQRDDMVLVA
jgi:poly-gamma-glutamate synthesis protein (capsule biosynthesis protein)